jgi:hypothetical protein
MPSTFRYKNNAKLISKDTLQLAKATIDGPTKACARPLWGALTTCLGDLPMKKNQGADFRGRPSTSTAGTLLQPGETTGMAGNSG